MQDAIATIQNGDSDFETEIDSDSSDPEEYGGLSEMGKENNQHSDPATAYWESDTRYTPVSELW